MEDSYEWTEGSIHGWTEGGERKDECISEQPILLPEWQRVAITGHYMWSGMEQYKLNLMRVSKEND